MLEFTALPDRSVAQLIRLLRPFSPLSIGELNERIQNERPVIVIEPFTGDWDSDRELLASVVHGIVDGRLPLVGHERFENGERMLLTAEFLRNHLIHLREIEVDTARSMAIEAGEITDHDQFVDDLPDWTGFLT